MGGEQRGGPNMSESSSLLLLLLLLILLWLLLPLPPSFADACVFVGKVIVRFTAYSFQLSAFSFNYRKCHATGKRAKSPTLNS